MLLSTVLVMENHDIEWRILLICKYLAQAYCYRPILCQETKIHGNDKKKPNCFLERNPKNALILFRHTFKTIGLFS